MKRKRYSRENGLCAIETRRIAIIPLVLKHIQMEFSLVFHLTRIEEYENRTIILYLLES